MVLACVPYVTRAAVMREKIVVHHVEEIARREAVGRVEDVRLAPANELLARFDGQLPARISRAQPPHGEHRPLPLAIPPRESELALGLAGACPCARRCRPRASAPARACTRPRSGTATRPPHGWNRSPPFAERTVPCFREIRAARSPARPAAAANRSSASFIARAAAPAP